MEKEHCGPGGRFAPSTALREVPCGNARWSGGFLGELLERGRGSTRDSLRMALWHPGNSAGFSNFKTAALVKQRVEDARVAGETGGPTAKGPAAGHQGTFWSDGDCYKYMEGLSHLFGGMPPGEARDSIKAELDELIRIVASAQEADGYINTQIQIPGKTRWVIRRHHEDYNLGHLFTAAVAHRAATGEGSFIDIARRAADCAYDHFIHRRRDAGQFGWNPTHIPGLVDLYRATGEARYLELARVFLDHRGAEVPAPFDPVDRQGPDDENQMAVPFREETEAVGHAVTAAYLYQGAAEIYRETGDATLLAAAGRIMKDITGNKMYLTGAVGAVPMGKSKRGHSIHEAFGREFELPHRTAYNETCANIAFAMFCRSMLLVTGEARHADVMEQVLYNGGISGISVDGSAFCYANPLRSYAKWHAAREKVHTMNNFTFDRWKIHTCYCCPPQQFRFIAQLQDWAYCTAPGALYAILYGSGEASVEVPGAGTFRLRQETRYPWDGSVSLVVDEAPDREAGLFLRIPGWSRGCTATLNGRAVHSVAEASPGSFASVKRLWKAGDAIDLNIPLPVRLIDADPRVETCRGQVAVGRGPLVYCAESIDLGAGVALEDVAIGRDFAGEATYRPGLLGGVVVIEGDGYAIERGTRELYGALGESSSRKVSLRLIPYFAWNNRGCSDMTVWMALA